MFDTMPKAELHLHLDGALSAATVLELAGRHDLFHLLPGDTEEAIAGWYVFDDFRHFVKIVRVMKQLLRSADDFAMAIYALGQQLHEQHVRYAEITITPYSLIDVLHQNLSIEGLLDGLTRGRQQVKDVFDIEMRWIFDIPRNRAFSDYQLGGDYVPDAAEQTLNYALMGRDYGVIGLGLGGNEVNAPPEPFAAVFAEAKRQGLRSLPHAGESEGPASVWGAIGALQADRVGHGIRAVEDAQLMAELAERQIPLEVNLSSNVYLGFYPRMEDHPLPLLDQAGVIITINSDDPQLISTSLSKEYQLLTDIFGYDKHDLMRIARNAFSVSFAEPDLKRRLLAEFDAWAHLHKQG